MKTMSSLVLLCRSQAVLLLPVFCLLFSLSANADEPPAEVMFLGTYHFANPGLDVVKIDIADVLAAAKQTQIKQVVGALARFKPTKIALEAHPDRQSAFTGLYNAYRSGQSELTRNERQQLGFRLAAQMNHEQIYLIDQGGDYPFDEVMTYAQTHNPDFVEATHKLIEEITADSNESQKNMTVAQLLTRENSADRMALSHRLETRSVGIGAGDTFVGANLVASWYRRNIMIFANLKAITAPGDRIVVLYGAGHGTIMRQLIESDSGMQLIDATDFLPPE